MEDIPTNGYTEGIEEAPPGRAINEIIYKEYEIKGNDNLLYTLRIFQEDNSILFYSKIINNLDNIIYKNELSLDYFYNLNNYFRQYLTCEEIFSIILSNIKNANIYKENKNNIIKFSFLVGKNNKEEEINIFLYPEKNKIENIMWNLCEKVKIIEEKNKEKEKKIYELDNFKKNIEIQIENKKKAKKNKINESNLYYINVLKNNKLSIFIFYFVFSLRFFL